MHNIGPADVEAWNASVADRRAIEESIAALEEARKQFAKDQVAKMPERGQPALTALFAADQCRSTAYDARAGARLLRLYVAANSELASNNLIKNMLAETGKLDEAADKLDTAAAGFDRIAAQFAS